MLDLSPLVRMIEGLAKRVSYLEQTRILPTRTAQTADEVAQDLADFEGETATNLALKVAKAGDTMTGTLVVSNTAPIVRLNETDAAVDSKNWEWRAEGGVLAGRTANDALGAFATWVSVARSGASIASVTFGNAFVSVVGFATGITTQSSTFTTTAAMHTILLNATGGAFTANLITASNLTGRRYILKKIDASANAITVDPNGAQTIDGAATFSLTTQYQTVRIQSDGSNWHII